jgi:hypothetical protein
MSTDRWEPNCWAIFALSVIVVALIAAHYAVGLP